MSAMKAFVAIDSFKGCLSTFEANAAARHGLRECGVAPDDITLFPVSDGGEGFCDVVSSYLDCFDRFEAVVRGPAGNLVRAGYVISGETAYIESASACGYTQVRPSERSPLRTSSFGLGQVISDALRRGARKIVVGMGGTATCDGGVGLLQALGVRFFSDGNLLADGAPAMLVPIDRMDARSLEGRDIVIEAWSDTRASFCGESGAVRVFGAQKGVTQEMSDDADAWMMSLASLYGLDGQTVEGAGAAGGIGGAMFSLLGAELCSGAEKILELSGLVDKLVSSASDTILVLTGEGKLDHQTLTGKLPAVVASAAAQIRNAVFDMKIICLAGKVDSDGTGPFDAVIQITPECIPLDVALRPDVASDNIISALCRWFA